MKRGMWADIYEILQALVMTGFGFLDINIACWLTKEGEEKAGYGPKRNEQPPSGRAPRKIEIHKKKAKKVAYGAR